MTYDTLIKVGPVRFTVCELMKQVVSANTLTEAHDKAYWIQKALMEDPNKEISDELNEYLKSYHNEPDFAIIKLKFPDGVEPPLFLTSTIFVTELKAPLYDNRFIYIDLESLWLWIHHNLVRRLKAKYEWLSLFLFAIDHGLIRREIDAKKFCEQMNTWFGEYTSFDASYTQVNCYQAGFFRSEGFKYRQWVKSNIIIPEDYTTRTNQKKEGFERIHELCVCLEENYDISAIEVKDSNR